MGLLVFLYILLLQQLTGISLHPTLYLYLCLDNLPSYIVPCRRPKQLYSSTNNSNIYLQRTEGHSTSISPTYGCINKTRTAAISMDVLMAKGEIMTGFTRSKELQQLISLKETELTIFRTECLLVS